MSPLDVWVLQAVLLASMLGLVVAWASHCRQRESTRVGHQAVLWTAVCQSAVAVGLGVWVVDPGAQVAPPIPTVLRSVATVVVLATIVVGAEVVERRVFASVA